MDTLSLLFPDIAMIAIGFALSRKVFANRSFWQELEKLVYFLLFPALLFRTVLRTDLGAAGALPAVSTALAAIAVGIGLGYLALPLLKPLPRQFASGVQCAFRFNSYVLLALAQRFAGEPGLALAAIIMGVSVPILNIVAVLPLARHLGSGLFRELARNPLILSTLGGLAGNLLGLSLPEPIDATIGRMGSASIALGLLATGAGLLLERSADASVVSRRASIQLGAWITAVKLVAMPATALLIATIFGLPPVAQQIAVLYAAMPTASSTYILASRMGGDAPFVAVLVTASMLGAVIALPFWINLVR
jgi:malonate transporter